MAECGSSIYSSNPSSSLSSSTDIYEESQVLERLRAPLRYDLARKRKLATNPPK